ncbi:MAG: hypothetical protein H0X12_14660 [Nocardioides sp.]|nr:hypothetical protein [Nocardioides sp.]
MTWTRGVPGLLAVVLLAGCGSESPAPQALPDQPPIPAGIEAGCPPADAPLRYADGPLPAGAVSVRLCPGELMGTRVGFVPPVDAVTDGVEDVVDAVNSLPEWDPFNSACPADGGYTIVYWFTYPDGDARAASFNLGGCRELSLGPSDTRGAGTPVAVAFEAALAAQRAATTPPSVGEAPDCDINPVPPASPLRLSQPPGLVTAVLCVFDGLHEGVSHWREVRLDASVVAAINSDYADAGTTPGVDCPRLLSATMIRGRNAWGDHIQLSGQCSHFYPPRTPTHSRSDPDAMWQAAPEVMAVLEQAARSRP